MHARAPATPPATPPATLPLLSARRARPPRRSCLLAAFVVAAKLAFDEPVWNEDFVKALRISNVQVSQISRWEADFLQARAAP